MESVVVRKVSEILPDEKHSLEHILGGRLRDCQRVFIMVFDDAIVPEEEVRRAAAARLDRFLTEQEECARSLGVTAEEAGAAIDEAMQHVRRRA